jgi:hypothetical protein
MLLPLHSTRRTYCTPISASKQAREIAKRNLSAISMKTVISLLIEIFHSLNALFTPFYTRNVLKADFSVETSPGNRKTQSFVDFDENCYFVPDRDISSFRSSFCSILHGQRSPRRFQRRNKPGKSQNAIFRRFR